jgi:High-affinity nickel-transport protein
VVLVLVDKAFEARGSIDCIQGGKVLSFAAVLALGFFLGMRHATDPDHVVAITTIVTKQQGIAKAGVIGALWGLGHTFTIFVVGAAIILFRVTISPRIGLSMEFAVAAMLILLGVLNLTGTLRWLQERFTPGPQVPNAANILSDRSTKTPSCDSTVPTRPESFEPKNRLDQMLRTVGLYNLLRPLAIGIVHGLAGSAAVAILVMTTIRDPWWAITYLLIFGIGTIAGMMIITAVIAMPFAFTAKRFSGWNRGIAVASGLLSLGFGLFLSYQIGFVDGLFSSSYPQWTPR